MKNASVQKDQRSHTDNALMLAVAGGDFKAFEILYNRYKPRIYNFILRNTLSEASARELYLDVWQMVIQNRGLYDPGNDFSDWLYAITHRRVHGFYRYREHSTSSLPSAVSFISGPLKPSEVVTFSQNRLSVNRALRRLPEWQRNLLTMRLEWHLSADKLASLTGESCECLLRRLRYASNKFRLYLRQEYV